MRQILYVSLSKISGNGADLTTILHQSRHNNALDGVTGLLWSDGRSFMQAIEGPRISVAATFERIVADDRHHALNVLSDRLIDAREFGTWTMAHRRQSDPCDGYDVQMRRTLSRASNGVRAQFMSLIATGAPLAPEAIA